MMPIVLTIRRASTSDVGVIAANNIAMAAETENKRLDPERVHKGVNGLLTGSGQGFYLLAELDGRVVGQMLVTFEWSDWRCGDFWWIQSVYIAPEARRRGVYRRLYEYLYSLAQENERVCGLRLYVDKSNRSAQAVYTALGMKQSHYDMYEVDFVIKE